MCQAYPITQSEMTDLPDYPIKLFKNREKVVVEEVKSEPHYYHYASQ